MGRLGYRLLLGLALTLGPLSVGGSPAAAATHHHHHHPHATCARAGAHACKASRRARHQHKAAPKPQAPKPPTIVAAATVTPAPPSAPAPVPPCQNTEIQPTPANVGDVITATTCLINGVRLQHGLVPLTPNAKLGAAAVPYTQSMITGDFFAHVTPSGSTPAQRILATGYIPGDYSFYALGENIAWGTLDLATPQAIVNAWVNSPEHLANILNPQFRDTAVYVVPQVPPSLAEGQTGATYDQEFGVVQR